MAGFGERIKARVPELADYTPEEIDAQAAEALKTPEGSARMAARVREWTKAGADYTDDDIVAQVRESLSPPPAAAAPSPEQMKARSGMTSARGARDAYQDANKRVMQNQRADAAGQQPPSAARTESMAEFRREVPHPANAIPRRQDGGLSSVPERVPEVDDFREFERLVKAEGLTKQQPAGGLAPLIATDKQGRARYSLYNNASSSTAGVEGVAPVKYVTGEVDPLQQGITQMARGVYDPTSGRALQGPATDTPLQPLTGFQVAEPAELGAPEGTGLGGLQSGYGFREYMGDVGEQSARGKTDMELAQAEQASYGTEAWLRAMRGIDLGEAEILSTLNDTPLMLGIRAATDDDTWLKRWSESNRKEAEQYGKKVDEVRDWRGFIKEATPAARDESAKLSGRYGGYALGETGAMFTPTGVQKAGGKVIGAVADAVPQELKTGARKLVADWTPEALSNTKSKFGIPDKEGRALIDAGKIAKRTAPDMLEETTQRELLDMVDAAAGGMDDTQKKALAREVLEVFSDDELRLAASPAARDVLNKFQPRHAQLFDESGLRELGYEYNPYHLLWGQDATKAARMTETAQARAAKEAGQVPWAARDVDPKAQVGVPGITQEMADAAHGTWKVGRPIDQVMNNTVERMQKSGLTHSEAEDLVKDFKELNFITAFSRTQRKVKGAAAADDALAKEIVSGMPELRAKYPTRYESFDEFANRAMANDPLTAGLAEGRTWSGAVRQKDPRLSSAMEGLLEAEDRVLVHVRGMPMPPGGALKNRVVEIPEKFADMNGMAVDRHFAQAIGEAATTSKTYSNARKWAATWDRALGLTQMRQLITIGSPGFGARVLTGDVGRHVLSEGSAGLDTQLRALVAEISEAGAHKNTRVVRIGKEAHTLAEWEEIVRKYGDVRASFTNEVLKREPGEAGVGTAAQFVANQVGKVVPGAERAIPGALNTAAQVASAPGYASGELADVAFRSMFNVNGRRLSDAYSAGDGIRMLNMLSMIKRGVDPRVAGQKMRTLMVDYADTNAAQEVVRPLIPFIKFYSAGMQGAVDIAMREPRRFSRIVDMMKAVERMDSAQHGGVIDPRNKPTEDQLTARPMYESAGRVTTARLENPLADVVDIGTALAGKSDQSAWKYAAPWATRAYALKTGRDAVTNRSVLGLDDEQMKDVNGWLGSQYMQARDQDLMANPNRTGAYVAMRNLPGLSNLMTSPVDLGLRVGAGMGSSSASRVPEDDLGALQRALPNWIMGGRQSRVDTVQNLRNKTKAEGKDVPETRRKQDRKAFKRGRRIPLPFKED